MLTVLDSTIRATPQDHLLSPFPRNYIEFMEEISPESLYEGLLGWGLFADKLPPLFSSESFMNHCCASNYTPQKGRSNWITFSYMRNIGVKRDFGIPNPFAYEYLIRHLSMHWKDIQNILRENTRDQPYRISRIHIRKRKNTRSLFSMNYRCWQIEEPPLPTLLIGNRLTVDCDISRCFPSIYTHALDWAILGKEAAKSNGRGGVCSWSHEVDVRTMNITSGETHGLLVGPHVSNLLSELILTRIDKTLFDKGYRFLRHIDDYRCYVDSEARAREFVLDLENELSFFGLSANQKKTKISRMPLASSDDWVRTLRTAFPRNTPLDRGSVERFIDSAISSTKETGNGSALSYAFKMLARSSINHWGRQYYGDIALHLAYAQPYLLPFIEECVIKVAKIPNNRIKVFSNLLYQKSITERDYLSAAFALYYAARYGFEIAELATDVGAKALVETADCVLCTCALVYAQKQQTKELHDRLIDHAKKLATDEDDFQRNWLFVYEALTAGDLPKEYSGGAWRSIKQKNISFIDWANIDAPLDNTEPLEDAIKAMKELSGNDDEGEAGRVEEQATNEL